jgi:hypothetical protein
MRRARGQGGIEMNRKYLEIARDPRIIPGVHRYCDEFCEHCAVRDRCLAFRCFTVFRRQQGRRDSDPTFLTVREATEFTRELAAIEGIGVPGLEAVLGGEQGTGGLRTEDPLIALAWEYALGVSLWLVLTPEELRQLNARSSGQAPEALVLWHHLRIHMKLVRATMARARAATGARHWHEDAVGCAKLTLVSVQRSREALHRLRTPASARTVGSLVSLLDDLERGIDERFPEARAYVRYGLDAPAA